MRRFSSHELDSAQEYIYLSSALHPPMPRSTSCEYQPPAIQPVLNTQPPPPPPLPLPPPPMPDLPPSPRKQVSSLSANARSQPQKKPGAPKPKGAVRAKSGCYTCRIRRKKCDEKPNEAGACETCVRLRLQCLGFGAKRPDWMRENNSVTELREKIKTFLASQGMIKGHSGSGPRTTDGDPPVLILVDSLNPHGNPGTPPTPALSNASSEGHQHRPPPPPQQQPPNAMAPPSWQGDAPHYPHPMPEVHNTYPPPPPPNWHRGVPEIGQPPDATGMPPAARGSGGIPPPGFPYPHPPEPILQSSSLVSTQSWPMINATPFSAHTTSALIPEDQMYEQPYQPHLQVQVQQPQLQLQSPAVYPRRRSSPFTSTYYYANDDTEAAGTDNITGWGLSLDTQRLPMAMLDPSIPSQEWNLVQHYLHVVLPRQYMLADRSIERTMYELLRFSDAARNAACRLSMLHMQVMRTGSADASSFADVHSRISAQGGLLTEGDAMAGLHVVSTFLFSGGRGEWEVYLGIAASYVERVLWDPGFGGPGDVLRRCSDTTRWIIKTTMWFDVLASVTTQKVPRFLEVYRELFGRGGEDDSAYISDPASGSYSYSDPEISMLPVMGCENGIVLAIAEISALACYKAKQQAEGALSMPRLVEMGKEIEAKYLQDISSSSSSSLPTRVETFDYPGSNNRNTPNPSSHPHPNTSDGGGGMGESEYEVNQRRQLTNDIFRASARIYLHTVLSGDFPSCPEIIGAVRDTIDALRRVVSTPYSSSSSASSYPSSSYPSSSYSSVHRGVVRSVVFAICLSGCLTDDLQHRQFLTRLLESQQAERVGNVREVQKLLNAVWERRDAAAVGAGRRDPVDWREVMKEGQQKLLLLV